jgi:DNA-binding XRE family transcriptional regulator
VQQDTCHNRYNEINTMEKEQLIKIRHSLGRTQSEMARLLGCSLKSIQSFVKGWRNVPIHIERQIILLLHMKRAPAKRYLPCWEIEKCPVETRENCPAWEFKAGHICWFINGTICHGQIQESWQKKMKICKKCSVFKGMMPR